jgi:hypothetical protein
MNFQFVITKHAVVVLLLALMSIPCSIASHASSPPCADTLAATSSEVKDCNIYLLVAPCGTVYYGTETNAVCAKTCGVCSEDGDTATTSSTPTPHDVVAFDASSPPCEDTLAATSSEVKDCSLLLLVAPCGTVSFGTETNAVCAKTCGVCSSAGNYVLDGLVQSGFMIEGEDDKDTSILLVGGKYGWNNAPPGAIGYADVSVTADTILRFVYHVGFLNVALVPSAQALEDCDVSQAHILAQDSDSPFDLSLDMMIYTPGDELFITSARELSTTSTGPGADECQFGARFKVTIVAKEEDGNDSGSSVVSSAAALFAVVMLSAILW